MKQNSYEYNYDWQQYVDYDKLEYDIKLKDGTIVTNCYPNAGKFNSISPNYNGQYFDENDVEEIRLSHVPLWNINDSYPDVILLNKEEGITKELILAAFDNMDKSCVVVDNGEKIPMMNFNMIHKNSPYHKEIQNVFPLFSYDGDENREININKEIHSYLSDNRRSLRDEYNLIIAKKSKLPTRLRQYILNNNKL